MLARDKEHIHFINLKNFKVTPLIRAKQTGRDIQKNNVLVDVNDQKLILYFEEYNEMNYYG